MIQVTPKPYQANVLRHNINATTAYKPIITALTTDESNQHINKYHINTTATTPYLTYNGIHAHNRSTNNVSIATFEPETAIKCTNALSIIV